MAGAKPPPRFRELPDAALKEPSPADEALEQAFGIRAPGRRQGAMSNERFIAELQTASTPASATDPIGSGVGLIW